MVRDGSVVKHLMRPWKLRAERAREARLGTILDDVNAALGETGVDADAQMRAALVKVLAGDEPIHDGANRNMLRMTLREVAEGRVR